MGAAVSGEASMSADISALVELLREAEWAASDEWDSKCPWCENYEHSHREPGESRHQADCKYARVLAESATSSPARVQSEDVSLPNGSATRRLTHADVAATFDEHSDPRAMLAFIRLIGPVLKTSEAHLTTLQADNEELRTTILRDGSSVADSSGVATASENGR
jgi:pyruvate-formate lyase-activating enzyme